MTTTLETPCREWQGARTTAGYGQRRVNGKLTYIHRWVMAQIHGWEALDGKVVMHRCDNPPCFRYDHLQVGTYKENMTDAATKGRMARGEIHCNAKLTESDVRDIRALYATGNVTHRALADQYGVARQSIGKIVNRERWSHIE